MCCFFLTTNPILLFFFSLSLFACVVSSLSSSADSLNLSSPQSHFTLHRSVSVSVSFVVTLSSPTLPHSVIPPLLSPPLPSSPSFHHPIYSFFFHSYLVSLIPALSSLPLHLSFFHPFLYQIPPSSSPSPEVDISVRSQPYLPPLFAPVYIIDRQGCFSSTIHQRQPPCLPPPPPPHPSLTAAGSHYPETQGGRGVDRAVLDGEMES